jgi:uncharacterized protein (TIGR02588 family)
MASRRQRQVPPVEWIASLIGGAIVLATVSFLAFETFRHGGQEPVLTVFVLQIREMSGSFVVDVEVRNSSRGAAADVHLAGSGAAADNQIQAQARIDYVPGFSRRRASLVFDSDPGRAPAVRIVGYARP